MIYSRLSAVTLLILIALASCTHTQQDNQTTEIISEKVSEELNQKLKQKLENYRKVMIEQEEIKANKEITEQEKTIYDMKLKIQEMLMSKSESDVKAQMNTQYSSFLQLEREWLLSDDPKRFFGDSAYSTNIYSIPMVGRSSSVGWSGSYWPMRNGGISLRYPKNSKNTLGQIDPNTGFYLSFYNWATSVSKYGQPAEHRAYSGSSAYSKYVDENYSPSEKYDLLIGDYDFTLTNFAKNEGAQSGIWRRCRWMVWNLSWMVTSFYLLPSTTKFSLSNCC